MPKKSKKFIEKGNSTHYHLLHRSHTDGAHAEEGVPSEFVLVPTEKTREDQFDKPLVPLEERLKSRRDHINELGFKNDGYDYSQHLKEMGGGRYIGKDGARGVAPVYKEIELPADALPSGVEMKRDFEAITIDHDLMEDDLHAALFEDADEDGDFEELDDDFCAQVMTDKPSDDFDFDAHIASLIARSERNTGGAVIPNVKSRGFDWDTMPYIGQKKKEDKANNEEEFEEFSDYEDDDESEYSDVDPSAIPKMSLEAMEKLDEQFENTLAEYGDDELGYIDYVDDEELVGGDAINEDDAVLQGAMDDFLQKQKDCILADGTGIVKKGNRRMLLPMRKPTNGDSWLPEGEEIDDATGDEPVDIKKEKEKQLIAQFEAVDILGELGPTANAKVNPDAGIETSQLYLKEEREENEWDCESILSTYSTLDNHPKLIKSAADSKFQPYQSRHKKKQDNQEATGSTVTKILNGSIAPGGGSVPSSATRNGPVHIFLGSKMNLPIDFARVGKKDPVLPSNAVSTPVAKRETQLLNPHKKYVRLSKISEEVSCKVTVDSDSIGTGRENEEQQSGGSEDSGEDNITRTISKKEKKKETPEEKKQRKLEVKMERREKRVQKKNIKEAFKLEGVRLVKRSGAEQSIDHVSVYHYANK